ncbi:hypothetical membrane protein, conserved [Thermococcus onnurineus NA1]|uniref:Hypothetical membrane protein, conserved n=1 Tax=Thermococcus onnurineus (strain NA1) TaxID=523850 RepID=B6YTR3_THEON|nr:membrane protein [Thermococcus onnurineus]ACJ17004.1 hypothetical membrane protein, conserved [Thermococcus onnurineus NA1]
MLTVERVIEHYFAVVIIVGGLSLPLGIKHTLRAWRTLPEVGWRGRSFGMGLLALVLASFLELPILLLESWLALAFTAGLVEETIKLLPLGFFRDSPGWEKWKLVIGTGLFLGLMEGILYTAGIIVLEEDVYLIGVRAVLIGLHTVWAAISIGFLLGGSGWERFYGLAFSMAAHTLYDLPPLAVVQGLSAGAVAVLGAVSTAFMLATPIMAKRAAELALKLAPEEEREELASEFTF